MTAVNAQVNIDNQVKDILRGWSKRRLQSQSVAFPNFNRVMRGVANALANEVNFFSDEGKEGPLQLSTLFMTSRETAQKLATPEQMKELRMTAVVAQTLAPLANDKAHMACPSPNYVEAMHSMKLPKKDVIDAFLSDISSECFAFTLPTVKGLGIVPDEHLEREEHYQGILFVRLYQSRLFEENTSEMAEITVPLELLGIMPGFFEGTEKGQYEFNFATWSSMFTEDVGLVMDYSIVAIDVDHSESNRTSIFSATRPTIISELYLKDAAKASPVVEKVEKLALNLIIQSISQGGVYSKAQVVKGAEQHKASLRKKVNAGKQKRQNNISIQQLKLVPDISLSEYREQEKQREFGTGTVSPHWRAAHFHSYWRGSGENRYLGLPQLVRGCFVDGSKAKAKRERKAKRLAQLQAA